MSSNKALQRILQQSGNEDLLEVWSKEASLSDINTFLLELFRNKTNTASPSDLLNKYAANTFVQPAAVNPIALKQLELTLLQIAEASLFPPIQLSPVAPLGSCSVVATADQNKIISALRGTEVVADATNLLALHMCTLLKTRKAYNEEEPLQFSTTHRHVRAQAFNRPGALTHFSLFCMVTSGRDKGSYSFEKKALLAHLNVYRQIFKAVFHVDIQVQFNQRVGYTDSDGLIQRLSEYIREMMPEIVVTENTNKTDNLYYKGLQFTIIVNLHGQEVRIGDGGFVDWSQQLLGNHKERMMISAIGLDRML
ncbi:hypothetical protein SAMN03159341_103120 [Paenibacillus sp. 1_12]|uniref:hypothetical protein n=1 Tax=Paenibacillus sp. 1_12 TaxID=1566278 RepID=UPI0008E1AAD2|nr:hypothetical protein [Paenibacillus sp. 1_12]SFL08301.1 hypothetical protein SAMN03159341_103120 [Paenibacillus sp. 1_12]